MQRSISAALVAPEIKMKESFTLSIPEDIVVSFFYLHLNARAGLPKVHRLERRVHDEIVCLQS
jgi:hypothetical protein